MAVDGDAPALGIEEAQHEPGEGALARPGAPHDGHVLAGGDVQVDVAKHRPAVVVAKLTFSNRISPVTGGSDTASGASLTSSSVSSTEKTRSRPTRAVLISARFWLRLRIGW